MTSTPHFALAQHPETGEWTVYRWQLLFSEWKPVSSWYPTRTTALEVARMMVDGPNATAETLATLDRLIAIERDHAAGDEAQVQTITKLGGAE